MRNDIEFRTNDGTLLCGWHYVPEGEGPFPTVVMATGFAGVRIGGRMDELAERFQAAGIASVVYDHRNLGDSEGMPRQEIDPLQQMRDYGDAVTFALTQPETDPDRMGAWGSSLAGGHVINLATQDRRVKAVVAQVPMVSGRECQAAIMPAHAMAGVRILQNQDRLDRMAGKDPIVLPVVSADQNAPCAMPTPDSWDFYSRNFDTPGFRNEVTLRSLELIGGYEPGLLIERVSPTPMLMIVATEDVLTPPEVQLGYFEKAREPKELAIISGGHFDVYSDHPAFDAGAEAATAFFQKHLQR